MNQSSLTAEPGAWTANAQLAGSRRPAAMVAVRLANLLSLALPLGGLAFFGIFAAPAMFRVARAASRPELAPQMVAQMLGRFGWVIVACSVLAALCWALDKPRAQAPGIGRSKLWWIVQGAASFAMLGVALFLQLGLMPRILAMQGQVLAQADPVLRASFDTVHKSYSSAAAILLWSALLALGCLARRSVHE